MPKFESPKARLQPLRERESREIELAFAVQDPCGEAAIRLAQAVLAVISDRDDVTCCALTSEMHVLLAKYPRHTTGGGGR